MLKNANWYNKYVKQGSLVKSFGIYTIARVLNSCIPFLLLPVMTAYLSPGDYGTISMITTMASFTMPFVTLRVEDAIVRRYYYNNENIAVYIGNCLFIVTAMMFFITLLFIAFASFISEKIQVPAVILFIIPFYCVLHFFKTIFLYYWQVKQKPVQFGVINISATVLELLLAIILVVACKMNWVGRAISIFTAAASVAIVAFVYLLRNNMIKLQFDKDRLTHALKYGIGLVPAGIGASLMVSVNRFFITDMVCIEETGLYGVATSFASMISFVTGSFNNAFVPWLFPQLKKEDIKTKRKIVKVSYLYMFFLFVVAFVGFLLIKLVLPVFVNDKFYDAEKYIPFLLLGYCFQGCYLMVTNYIMYVEKTYYTAAITLVCGFASIGLNYVFISSMGAIGASVAFAITFCLFFLMTWVLSAKLYKMPWILGWDWVNNLLHKQK